ncbi:MAG: C25 family cysteine peptidase [Bacteroidetes bacterium]|nr:C25 family cysteine peptidase [Bacteroidota bacterium]
MKKTLFSLFLITCFFSGFSAHWMDIRSMSPSPGKIELVSTDIQHSVIRFTMDGFNLREVQTPQGTAYTVSLDKTTPILTAGAPDLPKFAVSLVIPDLARMGVKVVSTLYKDYENIVVAPSKGVIMRDVDPSKVPYQYGKVYTANKFFPGDLTDTRDPFIIRDLRGQTLLVYPFQYNPVTKILRVYYDMTVEFYKTGDNGFNPLIRKTKDIRINNSFLSIYSKGFLNFKAVTYTPVNDYGKLLVISYGQFMDAVRPYVNWKNSIGYPAKLVNVADIGTTAAAIKSYISGYYNTYGLTFVLLVGDGPQIPTNTGGGLGGPSDNAYGYIVGNDHYADLFIGRFSAENVGQVQTQVQRSIDYEKSPQFLTDNWFTTVLGIGSDQGPGDDNEYDYQHIRGQQSQLLQYTYTLNPELFDGSQGGNDAGGSPGPADVSAVVNDGTGLVLYCGHGSQTSWGTTGFSNSNVNQLTNQGKLPFIWSVACVNGDFVSGTCFAEAWLRANQGGQPTGAIAFLGSTINQSWNSPMEGQDAMTDILAESFPDNIKRTFGGISINGCMEMIDAYGADGSNMADTWTIFGDPALQVRTANPGTMVVSNDPVLVIGGTTLTVTCNVNGARATATLNDSILATSLVANNTAVLTFPALPPNDSVHLVVTAYNYLPYITDIPIVTPSGPYIMYYDKHINDTTGNNNDLLDYGEDILLTVFVKNVGVLPTTNLAVKVRSTDPYISIIDSSENYGVVAPDQVKKVTDAFMFHTSNQIPDGHAIEFTLASTDGTQNWSSQFSVDAHSPVLSMGNWIVIDSTGNNNGRLDPGETDFIRIYVNNSGSSEAYNVIGHLVSVNPFVTVTQDQATYGNMTGGNGCYKLFTIHIDDLAPQGQTAPFLLELTADKDITGSGSFDLVVGKIPVLIVDYDGNTNSGPAMKSAVEELDLVADYTTTNVPDTLDQYSAIFVCLGVFPENHILSGTDGQKLATYLNNGGMLYMEGGDTWVADPQTVVHPMFHIFPSSDGMGDLGTILGYTGTFTQGMTFSYTGDNSFIDQIGSQSTSFAVFKNQSPNYDNVIANDAGLSRTIGSSFEFGGLAEGTYPSTKVRLMQEYLNFFGIQPPPLMANFIGFPTDVEPTGTVNFTDYSTGGITTWNWSFPGGTPAVSTDPDPVITYFTSGTYDVRLIVDNGVSQDTMLKQNYVHVAYPTDAGQNHGKLECKVQPNPGSGIFRLNISSLKDNVVSMKVMNTIGSTVYLATEIPVKGNIQYSLDLSGQPAGIYFLNIKGKESTITIKLIISK